MTSVRFLLGLVALLFLLSHYAVAASIKEKNAPHPVMSPVKKSPVSSIENLTAFPENISLPLGIKAALYIDSIEKIDEQEFFSANVKLRLRWHDARLRFDAWKNGGKTRTFVDKEVKTQLEQMWQPEIKISNLVTRQDSFAEKGLGLLIDYQGNVEYIQEFFAEFKINLTLTDFPFDTQNLKVILTSPKYDMSRIVLVSKQEDLDFSDLNPEVTLREWSFSDIEFDDAQFSAWDKRLHSQLSINLDAKRNSGQYVYTILMPLFLLLLTNYVLIIYIGEESLEKNVTVIGANLLAMIALDFTITLSYPELEGNSIVMLLFFMGYAYSWFLILVSLTVLNPPVAKHIASSYIVAEIVSFLRWSTPLFLMVVISYILLDR